MFLLLAASDRLQPDRATDPDEPARSSTLISSFVQLTKAMHRYLGVVVLTNVALGAAVWGTFHPPGVDRAGAWGLAAALLHFVPYVGAAAFTLGAALLASIQFHSLAHGLLVGGSGLGLSALIGVVLQTWLSGRSVRMNTVAVFISLMVWGWLWGLPGLLLATPLTVCIKVVCRNFSDLHWLASLLRSTRRRAATGDPGVERRGTARGPPALRRPLGSILRRSAARSDAKIRALPTPTTIATEHHGHCGNEPRQTSFACVSRGCASRCGVAPSARHRLGYSPRTTLGAARRQRRR